ncbi:MAG: trigger factor [Lachnospiraceae bacterium]|nr:trigger factor [Lachnospiraceae bacterium]
MRKRVSLTVVCVLLLALLIGCTDSKNNTAQNQTGNTADGVSVTPEEQPTPAENATPTETPTGDVTPTVNAEPTGEITPTAEVTPTGEITPTAEVTPSAETTPTPTEEPKDLLHVCGGEVVLGDYGKLTMPKESEVTDEDVQKEYEQTIANVLKSYPNYKKDESRDGTEIKTGDTVNIDFAGTLDGEAFEGGTAEDEFLTIGSGEFIADFENGLIGKTVGTTVAINATFPEDYGNEDLNGKTAVFTITINYVAVAKETADDEYIKTVSGGAYESIDAYLKELKQMMIEEAKAQYDSDVYKSMLEQMAANSEFKKIEEEDIAYYEKDMLDYYTSYATYYGKSLEELVTSPGSQFTSYDDFLTKLHEEAIKYVKQYMILQEVAKVHGITVTDEEYKKRVEDYMQSSGYTDQALFESEYPVDYLKYNMENDMALELLVEKAKANEAASGE